ncbi:RNA polymerase subunit sigma-70 [Nocardioides speluncae]|uniref:RNA polymerase subunit sigma-70 n=1 Tax=Nocardioides speluncae TaxID=2670337 RepID=UPI000D698BA1|nr:RNA polymerase subunit sigma-70 [Nocardioides speluncae]
MTAAATLIERAQTGDGEAFGELTEPFRRELQVHCYRMLGSLQDAEDAVQDTLVAAWQALADFEGRSSVRTWLYRIATNRCLTLRRAASRRPAKEWNVPSVVPPEPTSYGEVPWLEPYPDSLLDGALAGPLGPEARYEQAEAVSLAFITALQALPPRQLAVLILRDVLGLRAKETAEILDATVDTVNSLLKRARSALGSHRAAGTTMPPASVATGAEEAIVRRFVDAYQAADLDRVVALLTDDVFISMPPMPFEYQGRDTVARFLSSIFDAGRRFDLVATRANRQPAFGAYVRSPNGISHGAGIYVLTLNPSGNAIAALTRFENTLLPWFGLPRTLSGFPDPSAAPKTRH